MMFVHWKKPGQNVPGVWAICEAVNTENAAETVQKCIPKQAGYVDGIIINYHGADDLDTVKAAVTNAVCSARPLEMPLDVLVKVGDDLKAAWQFPSTNS